MAKKVRIFLSTVMAVAVSVSSFALAACGGGQQNGNNSNSGDPKFTVLDRAKELAENIDGLPTKAEILGVTQNGTNEKTKSAFYYGAMAINDDLNFEGWQKNDLSTPDDKYYFYTPYFWDQTGSIGFMEGDILSYKAFKDEALEYVKQLSTWVTLGGTISYRINYDKNSDAVTVEVRGEAQYMKIISSYNSAGKIVIKGTNTIVIDGKVSTSSSLYYVEDDICQYGFDMAYASNKYIVEKDFKTDTITEVYWGDTYSADEFNPVIEIHTAENGVKTLYSGKLKEDQITISYYDMDGNRIALYNNDNFGYIDDVTGQYTEVLRNNLALALYKLDGWHDLYQMTNGADSRVVLDTGSSRYVGRYEMGVGEYDYTTENLQWCVTSISMPAYDVHEPCIKFSKINAEEYITKADISELLSNLGLSINGTYLDAICKNSNDFLALLTDWGAMGIEDFTQLDLSLVEKMYKEYNFGALTFEQHQAIYAEPSIMFEEQSEENEVFALLDITVQDSVVLNAQSGEIDFSSVSATVPQSILLSESSEYSLVIALRGNNELIEVASVSETFNGEQFTLQGFGSADVKSLVTDGDYDLVAYIAKNSGDDKERLSQFYNLISATPCEYVKQWTETAEEGNRTYELNYTYIINASVTNVKVSQYHVLSVSN